MSSPTTMVHRASLGLAIALGLIFTTQAQATPLVGPHMTYNVTNEFDRQITSPPTVTIQTPNISPAFFGAPALAAPGSDTLTFPNLAFGPLSVNGQFEFQDGKLTMNITPSAPGVKIHSLTFDEGGAWNVRGPDGSATSEATLLFNNLVINSVNGSPTNIIVPAVFTEPVDPINFINTPQSGLAHIALTNGDVTFTSSGGNALGNWQILANFNIDAALANAGLAGGHVDSISVALDDQLTTNTAVVQGLSFASIDKKHFNVGSSTTVDPVPEPASFMLGAMAGFGILFVARRRSRVVRQA